jgi:hypothetical protein
MTHAHQEMSSMVISGAHTPLNMSQASGSTAHASARAAIPVPVWCT